MSRAEKLRATPKPSSIQLGEIEALEVEAQMHHPSTRREFDRTKGKGQMHRHAIRHLAEGRWKKHGGLDLIMGRVFQNKIVPDVIPEISGTNPLSITISNNFTSYSPSDGEKSLKKGDELEPGVRINCSSLGKPPAVYYQPFHNPSQPLYSIPFPETLYTLLVINPDEPNEADRSYTTRLHYMKRNISLSIETGHVDLMSKTGQDVDELSWEPPAPAYGSGTHRLIFFLIRQPNKKLVRDASLPARENFDLRKYITDQEQTVASIVGVNLLKLEYSKAEEKYTNKVWQEYRGADMAPAYRRAPREERYDRPMSSVQSRAQELREKAWLASLEEFERAGLAEGVMEAGDAALAGDKMLQGLPDDDPEPVFEG